LVAEPPEHPVEDSDESRQVGGGGFVEQLLGAAACSADHAAATV
jgi:hypothetical protein